MQLAPILGDLDANAAIGALARLRDPNVVRLVLVVVVVLLEGYVVGVLDSLFDVESDWERIKRVDIDRLVVTLHIHEQRLLVAQVVVVFDLISKLNRVGLDNLGDCFLGFLSRQFLLLGSVRGTSNGHWCGDRGSLNGVLSRRCCHTVELFSCLDCWLLDSRRANLAAGIANANQGHSDVGGGHLLLGSALG